MDENNSNDLKFTQDLIKQTNQAALDYALKAIQFLFLINGAAATAILAGKIERLYPSAIWFGICACAAILLLGLSYVYNLLLTEYLMDCLHAREDKPTHEIILFCKKIEIPQLWIMHLRTGICIFFALTIVGFFGGLIYAGNLL